MSTSSSTTTGNAVSTGPVNPVTGTGPHAAHWVILGVGVIGMVWLATTSFAPLVIAFLVAAVIYQGIHKGASASLFNWLG